MVTFYKYLALDKAEMSLFNIFFVSLILFSCAIGRPPVWECFLDTPIYNILVSDVLSNIIISLSASMIVAYVFHYVSCLHVKINQAKDLLPIISLGAIRQIKKWLLTSSQQQSIHDPEEIIRTALINNAHESSERELINEKITSNYQFLIDDIEKFEDIYNEVMSNFSFSTEVTYYFINIKNMIGGDRIRQALNNDDDVKLTNSSGLLMLTRHLEKNKKMLNFGIRKHES
ncbi:hypothetical protein LRP49_25015 [Enterovibrio sp. ZSDZ35]|uniref:Uncharacterized protein n=1 Tax=Enterovibrio qingdaonensis TaxID=2899818 RepID=A0ABT5QVA1_9GAMM|nr:hypothetical protein [Enterovibrio sp. ZSDZ35]MDD1784440.1 hypothetical protein [Enterovibrio sp. ZSDZ35]